MKIFKFKQFLFHCNYWGLFTIQDFVVDLLINAIRENQESEGMLISGFPRNVEQIHRFEKKVCLVYTFTAWKEKFK